jgi:shikimate 5-dehydrogenase
MKRPIFLDMAYHPRNTHLLKLADALGWQTISGEVAMIEQGLAQQRMWRLGYPSADVGVREGVVSAEAMRAAREAIEGMGKVHDEIEEVDLAVRSAP